MARLKQNKKNGDVYLIIWRGHCCTKHSLNSYGAERLKRLGYEMGHFVHRDALQILDQHLECQPPCGPKGQPQLIWETILKVVQLQQPTIQYTKRKAKILSVNFSGLIQQEFCFTSEPHAASRHKAA